MVDYHDPILVGGVDSIENYYTNLSMMFYPDSSEEIDNNIPDTKTEKLEVTVFVG